MRYKCIFITDEDWARLDQKIKYFNEHVRHFQKDMDNFFEN